MVERPTVNLVNSAAACAAVIAANLYLIRPTARSGRRSACSCRTRSTACCAASRSRGSSDGGGRGGRSSSRGWPRRPPAARARAQADDGGRGDGARGGGVYVAGYLLAWRAIGLDPSDRAVLDHLLHRRRAADRRRARRVTSGDGRARVPMDTCSCTASGDRHDRRRGVSGGPSGGRASPGRGPRPNSRERTGCRRDEG